MHDRGDGVEESESLVAERLSNRVTQSIGSERAGGNDRRSLGQAGALPPHDLDVGVRLEGLGHGLGEEVPVDGQSRPGRHARPIRRLQKNGSEPPHLTLQLSVGVRRHLALEGVRADELPEVIALMRRRRLLRPHLTKRHPMAPARHLKGRLASRKAPSHDFDAPAHRSRVSASGRATVSCECGRGTSSARPPEPRASPLLPSSAPRAPCPSEGCR